MVLPEASPAAANPACRLGRRRRRAGADPAVRRNRVAAAWGHALLAAAPAPLLMGLASATGSEPVTLGLAGLALTSLALQVRRLRSAARIVTRHRDNLARLAAPAVARLVAETDAVTLRAGWEQEATVLFADIRDFTRLCETLSPGEVAAFLAEFRHRAAGAVEAAGGLVDKFVGDEVMAVFGIPHAGADDTDRAVAAARALAAAMLAWSRGRARAGLPPVRIGIGLHRGPVFVGAIGAERVEFTVVGDTVNVARRLEQMTRTTACDCIASEAVVRAATSGEARVVAVQPVRGARAVLRLFALALAPSGRVPSPMDRDSSA
ncbi:adenylate/guanylate cyclase domain-containing protein [Methylobacterium sp. E-005]|uniref:adenylate/guanylate cyclase domain-containing protein n=1 Tax=Methylobacterium sp. E-005 TaxID=2836549 RepID=UPI001FBB1865|nr:adenylate/guanylate cyclase domain-containing protein [Methylobacterium sp. E-005]MCJ2086212.1 adenylate/guanylate cyclase domain-containing protein [Methylobacterium sp. E-005]